MLAAAVTARAAKPYRVQKAAKAEIVVLSVKPQYYEQTIAQIRDEITDEQVIVTLAPGKTLEWLQGQFGKDVKIVRTMPNTPALVGEGMSCVCGNAKCRLQACRYCRSIRPWWDRG